MISIVIPSRNDDIEVFQKTINAIKNQTVLPKEIIIVDSSTDNSIKNFVQNQKFKLYRDGALYSTKDRHEKQPILIL